MYAFGCARLPETVNFLFAEAEKRSAIDDLLEQADEFDTPRFLCHTEETKLQTIITSVFKVHLLCDDSSTYDFYRILLAAAPCLLVLIILAGIYMKNI